MEPQSPGIYLKFEKLNINKKKTSRSLFSNFPPLRVPAGQFPRNNSLLPNSEFSKVSLSPALKSLILTKRKNQKKFKELNHFSQLNPTKTENFSRISLEMTEDTQKIILEGLQEHFLFHDLSNEVLSSLIKAMFPCKLRKNEYLFMQGENASHFFFLERGILQLYINETPKKELLPGTAFGELALIYNEVRSASIQAMEDCLLWGLDRLTFSSFMQEINENLYKENREFLDIVTFFRFLNDQQKDTLALRFSKQSFQKNDIIINKGETGTSFYVIMSGIVKILLEEGRVHVLREGQCFGESTLFLENDVVKGTVIADTLTVCLAIGSQDLKKLFGENIEKMAMKYYIKLAFEKNQRLCHLTEMQKFKVIDCMEIREIPQKKPVDLSENAVRVPVHGDLVDENGKVFAKRGEVFGDALLLQENGGVSEGKCGFFREGRGVLAEISLETLRKTLNFDNFADFVLENSHSHENSHFFTKDAERSETSLMRDMIRVGSLEESKSNIDSFSSLCAAPILPTLEYIQKIKEGQMAVISLVMSSEKMLYIMKSYQTSWLHKFKSLSKYVKNEEEVVKFCNFPFIMDFFRSGQEQDFNLLLVEFVKGIDLFEVLRHLGLLEPPQARFYMGCLVLTLQYLHQHHIIYRDLKPDNVMVDTTGYIKLIDMGTAKFMGVRTLFNNDSPNQNQENSLNLIKAGNSQVFEGNISGNMSKLSFSPVKSRANNNENLSNSMAKSEELRKSIHNVRTFTIIGTPHYMAPEIITGKGYSFPVDYWALGIMLYEFLCGYVPYGDDVEDPYEIYEKIVKKKGKVKFPSYMSDIPARKLISQLLNESPDARLGGSFAALKNHEFFHGFEWNSLLDRKILPPFQPLEGVDFVAEKEIKKDAGENGKDFKEVLEFLRVEHEKIKKNLLF